MEQSQFFEKIARVFGATLSSLVHADDIPHKLRVDAVKRYYKDKSKEAPTSLLRALAVGGLTGAGLGGLSGAMRGSRGRRLKPLLIGAGVGGVLGAGLGGLMRLGDKHNIMHAKSFLKSHKGKRLAKALDREAASIYSDHKESRRATDYLTQERRHRELMRAVRGQHNSHFYRHY